MNVEQYVQTYEQIKASVKNDEIAAVILDQIGKDGRVEAMQNGATENEPRRVVREKEPATQKQKAFLEKLQVPFDKDITRKEASAQIDQAKSN